MGNGQFVIGKAGTRPLTVNIERLLETRLLIQGNSGAGKSHTVRKLLEETHGIVQHIVYDVDGDYATLRQQYDYIIAGPGGDVAVDGRTAAVLAQRVMELCCSVIINLSEMNRSEQREYMAASLRGLLSVRREHWNPCLVVIDEAHLFAPQTGNKEYASTVEIANLCTQGRKRMFAAVLSTQRLSSLHKDAAAQCENVLVGKTFLDLDVKRAAEILQLGKQEQHRLRGLTQGDFFAYGEAFGITGVEQAHIGQTRTQQPPRGRHRPEYVTPPPRDAILSVLGQLGDLPKQARERNESMESKDRRIRDLERELKAAKESVVDIASKQFEDLRGQNETLRSQLKASESRRLLIATLVEGEGKKLREIAERLISSQAEEQREAITYFHDEPVTAAKPEAPATVKTATIKAALAPNESGYSLIGSGPLKILTAIAQFSPLVVARQRVSTISGYSIKSSTFQNYISSLVTSGLIERQDGGFRVTDKGISAAGQFEPLPIDAESLVAFWSDKLGAGPGKMLSALHRHGPLSKEQLAQRSGYSLTSSTFQNYVSALRTNALVETVSGKISLSFHSHPSIISFPPQHIQIMSPTIGKSFPRRTRFYRRIMYTVPGSFDVMNPHTRVVKLSCHHECIVGSKRYGLVLCTKCKEANIGSHEPNQA